MMNFLAILSTFFIFLFFCVTYCVILFQMHERVAGIYLEHADLGLYLIVLHFAVVCLSKCCAAANL